MPRRLVLQLSADLPKGSIRDMPGKAVVSDHPSNDQVFNNDGPVLSSQYGGELVDGRLCAGRRPGPEPYPRRQWIVATDSTTGSPWWPRRTGRPCGTPRASAGAPYAAHCSGAGGLGICSPVERTARVLIPRSTPTSASGAAGVSTGRCAATVNDTHKRPPLN